VNTDPFGYHTAVIPDDAAGRPLSPTELDTIADLERRLLLDIPTPRVRGTGKPRRLAWPRSANATPLAALLVAGVLLMVAAGLTGAGLVGVGAVLLSVVATAFAWPLLPRDLGGPVRPRRFACLRRLARPH
jgi:hypothetical protein